jgi:hypothetical protein
MSRTFGPNLGLLINANDAEAYATELRAFLRGIDIIVQPTVLSRSITTPPGSPSNGNRYLVPIGGAGAWTGKDNNIRGLDDGQSYDPFRTVGILSLLRMGSAHSVFLIRVS